MRMLTMPRLAHDPVFKLIGRDAVDGHDLASQPTLSRFENTIRRRDLLRMSEALAEAVLSPQASQEDRSN